MLKLCWTFQSCEEEQKISNIWLKNSWIAGFQVEERKLRRQTMREYKEQRNPMTYWWSYENDCQPQGDAGRPQPRSGRQSITMAGDDPPSMVQFLKPWWLRQNAASGNAHSRENEGPRPTENFFFGWLAQQRAKDVGPLGLRLPKKRILLAFLLQNRARLLDLSHRSCKFILQILGFV